jgi:hypothetical protein
MKKVWKILLIIFVVLLVGVSSIYLYLTKSSTISAYLSIESGQVFVDSGKGFVGAEDGMKLKRNYIIKTGENSEASVVFYESVVVSLDPNTEISIEELSKKNINLKQNSGSSWTKFMTIMGVSGITIETPNTVATVRGTNFGVDMFSVFVDEGLVNVKSGSDEYDIGAGENSLYEEGKLTKGKLTEEQKKKIIEFKKRQISILKEIRIKELEKKKIIVEKLLQANGLSFEELPKYLEDIDRGEGDLNEISKNIPIKIESTEKVIKITEKIREEKSRILELEGINGK